MNGRVTHLLFGDFFSGVNDMNLKLGLSVGTALRDFTVDLGDSCSGYLVMLYVVVIGAYLGSCGGDIRSRLIVFLPAADITMQYVHSCLSLLY